ncbi:MAG: creatininase family protein [Bacillota bacterium]
MLNCFSKWPELHDANSAILPVGSVEQHGLHLPLFTDSIIAQELAKALASQISKSYLLPLLPFSSSYEHQEFPGTISIKINTLCNLISDIIDSLNNNGIHKCVIVNGHQGNFFLTNLVQELNRSGPGVLLVPSRSQWDRAYIDAGISANLSADMHAGEAETSIISYLAPETINCSAIKDVDCKYRPLFTVHGMKKYSYTGAIGFPSRATVDKGKLVFNSLVTTSIKIIEEFLYNE